jgi:hypothetical protein
MRSDVVILGSVPAEVMLICTEQVALVRACPGSTAVPVPGPNGKKVHPEADGLHERIIHHSNRSLFFPPLPAASLLILQSARFIRLCHHQLRMAIRLHTYASR